MAFELERLFVDVFAPQSGDVVTIMFDLPHGEIRDEEEWRERREMLRGSFSFPFRDRRIDSYSGLTKLYLD